MGKVFTSEDYIKLKEANNGSTDLVIPEGYDEIGAEAFYSSNITAIEIPSTVRKIGVYAFAWCCRLRQVKFVEGSVLEEIGDGAFANCLQLRQVSFAEDSKLEEIGMNVFYNAALTEISLPSSLKRINRFAFGDSNLEKVIFGKDAIIEYDDNGKIRKLTIHTRNKELARLLIYKNDSCEDLVIKYDNYQLLDEFIQQLNGRVVFFNRVTLIGEKLSIRQKSHIKKKLKETIGNLETGIVFEKADVIEENEMIEEDNTINDKRKSVLSKENEELLGNIKSTCVALSKEVREAFEKRISSLLELYDKKIKQAKPDLSNYLNPTNLFQTELSMEGDLEQWLYNSLLNIKMDLINYDSIIFDLKRLESCRELLKLEIETKPKESSTVEDIIMTIMYLVSKVDDIKKKEVIKTLESYLKEVEDSYNTKLLEMNDSNEDKTILDARHELSMVSLKAKLLSYMEELSKYVIKVTPYLSLLETLKTKEVLEYKGATNSIYDTILGVKYAMSLIANPKAESKLNIDFTSLCNEFIEKIESIIPKINEVDANAYYLNLEKELSQRLHPILEKLDVYANQNDYMTQLINCRNMLKSNGEVNLDSKKSIESYISETCELILNLPLNEQETAKQQLLAVIEKWINNMPEEKNGLNLLREIYSDITEINFSVREYLDAKVDYESKFRR